ncbi:MAG TPA: phosphotransferase family protein [Myxococcaceae bacterium]|nr:phosphotransferase family protein [Myxococcaceae bacterium]
MIHLDEADEVRADERFDPERLRPVLADALPGATGAISVQQFRKGHSNLTYLVRGGPREVVLRRAPFGVTVKSAHDMRREFTVLTALHRLYPKVPRPLAFCDDESVIGAKFYLMERVRGVILRSDAPPEGLAFTPEYLRATSTELVDTLAQLHSVDVVQAGLASFGRPEGYVERQVKGWTERYFKAKTDELPEVEQVAAWLGRNMPRESGAALVHNDYKYDNVVFDPETPTRIIAVLDWEMSTVGDPLMDLGTSLGYWIDPDDPLEMRGHSYGPSFLPGSLSRVDVVQRYAERTGREIGNALFYYAFALFKIAVIVQQLYKRYKDGLTRDSRFGALIDWVRAVSRQATRALDKGRIHHLGSGV